MRWTSDELLIGHDAAEARDGAARPLACGGFIEVARRGDLAMREAGDVVKDEGFALRGLQLIERVAQLARALAGRELVGRLRSHELERHLATAPAGLEGPHADVARDAAQP